MLCFGLCIVENIYEDNIVVKKIFEFLCNLVKF